MPPWRRGYVAISAAAPPPCGCCCNPRPPPGEKLKCVGGHNHSTNHSNARPLHLMSPPRPERGPRPTITIVMTGWTMASVHSCLLVATVLATSATAEQPQIIRDPPAGAKNVLMIVRVADSHASRRPSWGQLEPAARPATLHTLSSSTISTLHVLHSMLCSTIVAEPMPRAHCAASRAAAPAAAPSLRAGWLAVIGRAISLVLADR
jgi:hypothetical protein